MPYIVTTEQGRIAAAQRDAADSVAKIEDKIVDYCVAHDVDLGQEDRSTLPESDTRSYGGCCASDPWRRACRDGC